MTVLIPVLFFLVVSNAFLWLVVRPVVLSKFRVSLRCLSEEAGALLESSTAEKEAASIIAFRVNQLEEQVDHISISLVFAAKVSAEESRKVEEMSAKVEAASATIRNMHKRLMQTAILIAAVNSIGIFFLLALLALPLALMLMIRDGVRNSVAKRFEIASFGLSNGSRAFA